MADLAYFSSKGAFSLKEFLHWSGIGRTKTLEEITGGRLRAVKVGRRLLIPVEAAQDWLAAQPRVGTIGTANTPPAETRARH
ncbi:hypothetical protein FV226_14290 [Methylobacterium sp. WL12]|uniref:hypothetical protein n=1 Tax=Methylobacterium sp. WL12 TaxID=2603890 RepID=UPI0011CAD96D|nr:hypothetical protein [Methylobacterium sp. WL12]TXM71677.1 hypothetical protein FV226_14290 [Methylobacterium sp. WL12]